MYQTNSSEFLNSGRCESFCCRLYTVALAFLAVLILFTVGLILGIVFSAALTAALPIIITAAVLLAVMFIVIAIIRGCCRRRE